MPVKDFARHVRDEVLPRERFRRAHREVLVGAGVRIVGDQGRIEVAPGVAIHGPTTLSVLDGGGLDGSCLRIGPRTYIGEFNNLRCAGAPITIGADCLISQGVTIVGTNHRIAAGRPVNSQDWYGNGVVLGDDVWVGAGVTILPGAVVGDGAVLGANSVIRGTVAPGAIMAGVPAEQKGVRA